MLRPVQWITEKSLVKDIPIRKSSNRDLARCDELALLIGCQANTRGELDLTQPTPATPDELIALAKRGDRDAFAELYERLKTSVWRWAYRALQDPIAAEEVTADCFLAMLNQMERLPDELPSLAGWLRRVSKNKSCDWIRRNQTRRKGLQVLADQGQTASITEQPHQLLESNETSQRVNDALDRLPDEYQIAVQWRYLDDLSIEEIAGRMNQSLSATNSLLHRARKKLHAILVKSLDNDPRDTRLSSTQGSQQ